MEANPEASETARQEPDHGVAGAVPAPAETEIATEIDHEAPHDDTGEDDGHALSIIDEGDDETNVQVLVLDSDVSADTADSDDGHDDAADEEDDTYASWMRHNFAVEELATVDELRRHAVTAVAALDEDDDVNDRAPRACDECNRRAAVLDCADCALSLCVPCTDAIHIIESFAAHGIAWIQPMTTARGEAAMPAPVFSGTSAPGVERVDSSPSVIAMAAVAAVAPPSSGGRIPMELRSPTQVEHRLHLPVGTKLFFRADDCGRWSRELLHGAIVGLDHGVRSSSNHGTAGGTANGTASDLTFYYRVLWLRGVEALANGFFRANLVLPAPAWPVEIGLFPSQLSAFRAVLTAERLARAMLRRERVSGRWHDATTAEHAFPSVEIVNEILDATDAVLGHEFRTRLTQQDDAAFLRAVGHGTWQFDAWMASIGRGSELSEEAAAMQEADDAVRQLGAGSCEGGAVAELLLLWSPRNRVRFFSLEQHALLLREPVQRAYVATIVRQMLFVYAGFAWQRWRQWTARHRRHEQRQRRAAAATRLAQWWRRRRAHQQRMSQELLHGTPLDALARYGRRQAAAATLYAFLVRKCTELQRQALRHWARATVGTDESCRRREARAVATAKAARGEWHPSHGIVSLPRLPRVYAHKRPDGGVAIDDLALYKQFRATHAGPTESSYWVVRARVLMGAYPAGVPAFRDARRLVSRADYVTSVLLEHVGTFVCLAERQELEQHEPSVDAACLVQLQQQRAQQRSGNRGSVDDATTTTPTTTTPTVYQTPWLFERIVRAKHELLRVELTGAVKVSERLVQLAQRELDDVVATLPVPSASTPVPAQDTSKRETLATKLALATQNARKARETLAQLAPLDFVWFPLPRDAAPAGQHGNDGTDGNDAALEAFLVDLEHRLRRHENLYVFSLHGHGRTGVVAALLLGRLYGLTATDALEFAQRLHDCQPAMHGVRPVQCVASPHAASQVAAVVRLLAQWNDAVYARVVRENSAVDFVQWRAQQRGLPLDSKSAERDGFLISDRVDDATQHAQQREVETLRRVAKRESAATRLRFARARHVIDQPKKQHQQEQQEQQREEEEEQEEEEETQPDDTTTMVSDPLNPC